MTGTAQNPPNTNVNLKWFNFNNWIIHFQTANVQKRNLSKVVKTVMYEKSFELKILFMFNILPIQYITISPYRHKA